MKRKKLLSALNILLLIIIIAINNKVTSYAQQTYTSDETTPDITAESAILIDATSGQILYSKNENTKHYPASITKLMTALLAVETLDPEDTITFSQNAVMSIEYGSSHIGIQADEILTINQAMHGLLLMSANEIANGIAEKTSGSLEEFANKMNQRCQEIGAMNTHFVNPHGLHDENHYTTAYDMALITRELIKNEYFLSIMKDITYQIPITNKSTEIRYLSQQHKMMNEKRDASIYREDVIGGKTGFTNEAGHTLVTIAKKDNRTLIVVLLKSESKNIYSDTSKILDYGFNNFKTLQISASDYNETLPIMKDAAQIGEAVVTLKDSFEIYINKFQEQNTIDFQPDIPTLTNEIEKGDTVGTVSIYDNNQLINISDAIVDDIQLFIPQKAVRSLITIFMPVLVIIFLITLYYYFARSKKHYSKYKKRNQNRR